MTETHRVRVGLSGSAVTGPGVSTFHFQGAAPAAFRAALIALYAVPLPNMPNSLVVTVPASGEIIEDSTGEVTGVWADGAGSVQTGGDPGAYARGVGARIAWTTTGLTNGRRVRGSTFLVPLGAGAYQTDGSLNDTFRSNMAAGITTFLGTIDGGFGILTKAVDGAGGKTSLVTSGIVPDRVSWLVSRRT